MATDHANGVMDEAVELWRHPNPESTELFTFQQHIATRHGLSGSSYDELWKWSIEHPSAFWKEIWEFTGIKATKPPSSVGWDRFDVDMMTQPSAGL